MKRNAHEEILSQFTVDRMNSEIIQDVTGAILAGGLSKRMGQNKALLPFNGIRLIQSISDLLKKLFREVVIVTNSPEVYNFLPLRKIKDIFPGFGALAGIHSALYHSTAPYVFVVACDMPFLQKGLISYINSVRADYDIVVPVSSFGLEPLHALYSTTTFEIIDKALTKGQKQVISVFDCFRVKRLFPDKIAQFDPEFRAFWNLNTPDDYKTLLKEVK